MRELPELLERCGIKHVIVDIDQTVVAYGRNEIDPATLRVLSLITSKRKCCFLSNSPRTLQAIQRIKDIERKTDIVAVISPRKKPDCMAFRRALDYLGASPTAALMVGDRLFTDILGANALGIVTVKVPPIDPSADPMEIKIPRMIERLVVLLMTLTAKVMRWRAI
jgi:HAD superfamily phosphatase (TIGR01668 family)